MFHPSYIILRNQRLNTNSVEQDETTHLDQRCLYIRFIKVLRRHRILKWMSRTVMVKMTYKVLIIKIMVRHIAENETVKNRESAKKKDNERQKKKNKKNERQDKMKWKRLK